MFCVAELGVGHLRVEISGTGVSEHVLTSWEIVFEPHLSLRNVHRRLAAILCLVLQTGTHSIHGSASSLTNRNILWREIVIYAGDS